MILKKKQMFKHLLNWNKMYGTWGQKNFIDISDFACTRFQTIF